MARRVILAIMGVLLVSFAAVHSSPLRGHYREPHLRKQNRGRVEPGETYEFRDTFRGNQRSCVIVEGDHKPPTDLILKVFDSDGKIVASDVAGGDFVAVIWYPTRTQEYRITINCNGKEYNDLDIVVK